MYIFFIQGNVSHSSLFSKCSCSLKFWNVTYVFESEERQRELRQLDWQTIAETIMPHVHKLPLEVAVIVTEVTDDDLGVDIMLFMAVLWEKLATEVIEFS